MVKARSRSTRCILSVGLVLILLISASALTSAQPCEMATPITELAKLAASDGAPFEGFGRAVSVSVGTIVIGAYSDDDSGTDSGSSYVYERDTEGEGSWVQTAKLTASDGEAGDWFGASVSISGDTAVVGAPWDEDKGCAYLFERDEGSQDSWREVGKLSASDGAWSDWFGDSVSISGDTVVVGAWGDGSDSGSVYLFEKPEAGWANMIQTAKLSASDGIVADCFGDSVSISGDTVVVGAVWDDDAGPDSGSAYVFERDEGGPGNWGQAAKLSASDGAQEDLFGESVSISGDTVVVGATRDDDSYEDSGSVYLFEKPEAGWTNMTQTAKLSASDGAVDDRFGLSVSIRGDAVVVGAPFDDDRGINSGSAYLFEKPETGWIDMTETVKLTASDGAELDGFGWSVSSSSATVVVGAQGDDDNGDNSGSAYLYWHFTPVTWVYLPVVLRGGP